MQGAKCKVRGISFFVFVGILLLLVADVMGQFGDRRGGRRFGGRREIVPMERDIFPGNVFTFCRAQYTMGGGWGRAGRGGWATDYPEADENFSLRLSQITTLNINRTEEGQFQHAIVQLDEDELFKYPFLYMCNVHRMQLTGSEQVGLRSYLLRGGFMMVDDFWGDEGWENWVYEIEQVFSPGEYPMVEIPLDHEIFHIVFDLDEVPQVPGIHSWGGPGVSYEIRWRYDHFGNKARCWGIFDHSGRLMVVAIHNTDLGDGWEREGVDIDYFKEYSAPKAYPMGINIVVYAMTH